VFSIYFAQSQTIIEKNIPVNSGQKVVMNFERPELINITTWDKNEISIKAEVSINYGANDDAFEIEITRGNQLEISSTIKDYDNLPSKIVIKHNGKEYFFDTDDRHAPEVEKFLEEVGSDGYQYLQFGVIIDIVLHISVPKDLALDVDAKYGMVELIGFTNDLNVHSKFGGIDVSVASNVNTLIQVKTKFGETYSNLDVVYSGNTPDHPGNWQTLEAEVNDPKNKQFLRSEFGNIYIRKL
jgi:hypothetical protein